MSNLDSNHPLNDNIQQQAGSDRGNTAPLVDMSNPAEMQTTFKSNTGDSGSSVVSPQGEMMFSSPYESANQNNWNANNWKDGGWNDASGSNNSDNGSQGAGGDWRHWAGFNKNSGGAGQDSTVQSGTDAEVAAPSAWTDSSSSDQSATDTSATNPTQQLELQIAQLQAQLAQLSTEFAQIASNGTTPTAAGADTAAGTGSTAANVPSGGDTPPASATTPASAAPETTVSQPATTASAPADPLLAQMQQIDPTMAQTLTAASTNMSTQGYSQLEQYIGANYTNSGNDSQLMSQALSQAGLNSTDDAALTNVLQADMPSALGAASSSNAASGDVSTGTPSTTQAGDASSGNTTTNTSAADTPPAANPANQSTTKSDTGNITTNANGTSESASTTPGAADTYHVSGDQIIGPNGKPFIMTGINDTSPTEHDELTGDFGTLASQGANTVRLTGTAADLENPNDAFNQEVQSALSAGMFVDITDASDESQYGVTGAVYSPADVSEAAQALQTSAAMYANNPNVGFNVANEQGASGDANNPTLLSNTETLLAAVNTGAQSVNPNADPIKFVDDSTWGQGAFSSNLSSDSFLDQNASALESYGNVVGAVHDYESSAGQYNTAGINAIQAQGMPVIAEEVGVQDPTIAADSFNTLSQTQSTTGDPIGGLVWIDGTQPGGSFYNNVMNTSEAPAIQNFWQTIDSESASASAQASA